MIYRWECTDPARNSQVTHGCWGYLSSVLSKSIVTSIGLRIEPTHNGLMQQLINEKVEKGQTLHNAKVETLEEICHAIFGKNVEYKVTQEGSEYWVSILNISKMPKNHTMYYLFGLRCAMTRDVKFLFKELRDRGIKSTKKMVIGTAAVFVGVNYMGKLNSVSYSEMGSNMFNPLYTTLKDIKDFYRGTPLRGPKDETWEAGGGYTSGNSGSCVQISGAQFVESKYPRDDIRFHLPVKYQNDRFVELLSPKGRYYYDKPETAVEFVDTLATFLKGLK